MSGTRTYQAYTMAEALAAVKYDLGAEAIILTTRTFKRGGLLGLGRRTVVEVTASAASTDVPMALAGLKRGGGPAERAYAAVRSAANKAGPPDSAVPGRQAAVQTLANEADRQRTRRLAMVMQERHARDKGAASAQLAQKNSAQVRPIAAKVGAAVLPAVAPLAATVGAASVNAIAVELPQSASPPAPMVNGNGSGSLVVTVPASAMSVAARRFILRTPDPSQGRAEPTPAADSQPAIPGIAEAVTTVQSPPATPASIVSIGAPPTASANYLPPLRSHQSRPASIEINPQLQNELAAIKHMVGQVLQRQTTSPRQAATAMPPKLFDLYLQLVGHDLPDDLAEAIIAEARARLTPDELSNDAALHEVAVDLLADRISTAPLSFMQSSPDSRPLTIALIGPTGVGKTTTLAKLAASFKLKAGRKVGLITSDTYRIAAVDQLRTYANIIGLPLQVAMTPPDMRQAMEALSDQEVILVDTAGRSQNDVMRVAELRELIETARPHQTHMVLSGTANARVLDKEAQAFGRVGVDRVILTKLDEAASLGALMGLLQHLGKPVSFITTGQEVPNDLEMAESRRLAELALGGTLRP